MNRSSRLAVLLLAVAAFLPLLPPLIQGHVLTLRDHSDYFVPMRAFTAEVIRAGELPLWNPYNGGGERWLANPQTAVFYPPAWMFLFLPLPTAYVLFLAAHLVLLGLGSFWLFRYWSAPAGAAFGAVAAALSGATMSLLDVGNNLASLAWLPWIATVALRSRVDRWSATPALLLTLCFLGGEPLVALSGAALLVGISFFRSGRKALAPLAATALTTIGLSAVQLLPFLEYLAGSDRAAGLQAGLAFSHTASLRDWSSVAVAPWAFANGGLHALSQSFIPSVYIGVPAVLAATIAVTSIGRFRRMDRDAWTVSIWLLSIVMIAVICSTAPQWEWAREMIIRFHLNVSRYPARIMPLGVLALCGLAALGLDRLAGSSAPMRFTACAIIIVLLAVFGAEHRFAGGPQWRPALGFAWLAFWFAAFGFMPRSFRSSAVAAAASLLLAVDLYAAAGPFLESAPFSRQSAPYASLLRDDRRFARLLPRSLHFDRNAWLAGYRNLLERKFDLSSPAPAIPARYLEMHDAALYAPRLDLLRFLSVEYLISDRPLDLPIIAGWGGTAVRNLPPALPFAAAWSDVDFAPSDGEAFRRALRSPLSKPIVTMERVRDITAQGDSEVVVSAPEFTSDRVTLNVRASNDLMLTLNQLDASGWSVSVDGVRADALRVNGLFRAVMIPRGAHVVEWNYRPMSLITGFFFSLTTAIFLLAWNAQQLRTSRSKKSSFHPATL